MKDDGFTLIEMIIVLAIASFILLIASQFFQNTNKLASTSIAMSGGINHVQQAANVVTDDVRRALFIVAKDSTPYTTSVAIGVPTSGSPAITKAGDNVLAMYTPKSVGTQCTASGEDYEYIVYYLTDRSNVTSGSEWSTVLSDASNTGQKVLMQFTACVTYPDPTTAVTTKEKVRVVSDYIGTGKFDFLATATGKTRKITMTLTPAQTILGKTVAGKAITTVATARNIY